MEFRSQVRFLCWGSILVFAAAWSLYAHTLKFDFIWDDFGSIVHNQSLRDWNKAWQSFVERPVSPGSEYDPSQLEGKNYRPLRTVIHAAIYHVVGIKPIWYHFLNVSGHAAMALLLFLGLFYLTRSRGGALVGALFFAVHPVLTEPVCWAKSLEDMLAALLVFGSFLCFEAGTRNEGRRQIWLYLACIPLYVLALTAKMSVVFLPVFLLLRWLVESRHGLWASIRRERLTVAIIMILGALTAIGLVIQHLVLGQTAQGGFITGSCWTTWLSMPRIFVRYLFIEFLPMGMLADYEAYPRAIITDAASWLYLVVLLVVFFGGTRLFCRAGMLSGWLWFWCALLPFSNLVPMVQLGADRFLYLATIGMAWLVAELTGRLMKTNMQRIAMTALLVVFALCAWKRSEVWRNERSLWEATVKQTPDALRARENLVKALISDREFNTAMGNAEILARRSAKPAYQTLYGYTLCLNGDYRQGIGVLTLHRADALLNIVAIDAIKSGRPEIAEKCFEAAIRINPNDPRYRFNLERLKKQLQKPAQR